MKVIAFYLPQFHPIPENDAWWKKGFTEWHNVAQACPKFKGHHQPQIPADLGFYDLRLSESRQAQASLAAEYGLGGFCYYHYWFNGKMLLERPFNEVLASGEPKLPFCLCWANEPWSRRWDGTDRDVLMPQDYTNYESDKHIAWLAEAFRDPRYIRIHGKPFFLIYNSLHIPELPKIIKAWRAAAVREGLEGLYLGAVLSQNNSFADLQGYDFDAFIEFHPNPRSQGPINFGNFIRFFVPRLINLYRQWRGALAAHLLTVWKVYSYKKMVANAIAQASPDQRVIPCVSPSWDNSARKRVNCTIMQNNDPALYGKWLSHSLDRVKDRPEDEQIVFINAWNEWAEGCHLEPDLRLGRSFLEETAKTLSVLEEREAHQ